jgi:hypothetical protein
LPAVHHCEKLLETGRYINKGYQVFIDNYFMCFICSTSPSAKHLHHCRTVRRNRKLLPQHFKYKFELGKKKCIADPVPFSHFPREEITKKNPVILLSSHVTAQEEEVREDMVAIHS